MLHYLNENREEIECARFALQYLKREGAQARITLNKGRINTIGLLNNEIDKLQMSLSSALTIQIYHKGRYGAFSTNRMERGDLERFLKYALSAISLIEQDPARMLPDKELYYRGNNPDLGQTDPNFLSVPAEKKREILYCVSAQIEGLNKIVATECEYNDYLDYLYIIDSQGFEADSTQTSFDIYAQCALNDGDDARYESSWYESSLKFNELEYSQCGTTAYRRGIEKLSPKKIKSGRYNMILENTVASRLVSPIIKGLSGAAVQQKSSFLTDSLNQKVFSSNLSIIDTPHKYGMAGSRYFDSEGVATKEMQFIERGVVKEFFIDSYNSKKLNMAVTAEEPSLPTLICNSTRGNSGTLKELMQYMESGILVTGFNGGNNNLLTADFSYGIEGFVFKNGEIIHPIREMNITGNVVSLWNNFEAAAADARKWSKWQVPSIAFKEVDFNGI